MYDFNKIDGGTWSKHHFPLWSLTKMEREWKREFPRSTAPPFSDLINQYPIRLVQFILMMTFCECERFFTNPNRYPDFIALHYFMDRLVHAHDISFLPEKSKVTWPPAVID